MMGFNDTPLTRRFVIPRTVQYRAAFYFFLILAIATESDCDGGNAINGIFQYASSRVNNPGTLPLSSRAKKKKITEKKQTWEQCSVHSFGLDSHSYFLVSLVQPSVCLAHSSIQGTKSSVSIPSYPSLISSHERSDPRESTATIHPIDARNAYPKKKKKKKKKHKHHAT